MTIAAIILLVITLILAFLAYDATKKVGANSVSIGFFSVASLLLVASLIAGWMAIAPEYRLYKATIEKRILVEQAKAEADAAVEEARAEIERARGTSEANLIVADSITEPYLRYLYINSLKNTSNQVIYLPTEAGLPILEAERFSQK